MCDIVHSIVYMDMELLRHIIVLLVTSGFIFFIGNRFAVASSRLGDALKLHKSVKGATFDAIASSLPEIMVALFSVIFFNSFDVGIGTIAGSALFNLLVIPGIAVLVAPVAFTVHKHVISRDAMFYVISVFILVALTMYFQSWGIGIAIFLLALYWYYVRVIVRHTKEFRGEQTDHDIGGDGEINIKREVVIAILAMLGMGIVTYFLTEATIGIAHALDIAPVLAAFVLTAAATSLPDTVISVKNAKNGDIDDAAANVFGSNIFDILVGLGLPLLIFNLMNGSVMIAFDYIEMLIGLLGATILVLYFLAETNTLSKRRAISMLVLYALFIVYVVALGKGLVVNVV